jgi:hypothetical protein
MTRAWRQVWRLAREVIGRWRWRLARWWHIEF